MTILGIVVGDRNVAQEEKLGKLRRATTRRVAAHARNPSI